MRVVLQQLQRCAGTGLDPAELTILFPVECICQLFNEAKFSGTACGQSKYMPTFSEHLCARPR